MSRSSFQRIKHIDMSSYTNEQSRKMITGAIEEIRSLAMLLAPSDDGNLRRSFSTRIDGLVGEVSNYAEYAVYVEYGTGIHVAGGRGTPWTYFSEKLNRFVTTSGNEKQEFMRPAFDQVVRNIKRFWETGK